MDMVTKSIMADNGSAISQVWISFGSLALVMDEGGADNVDMLLVGVGGGSVEWNLFDFDDDYNFDDPWARGVAAPVADWILHIM